MKKNTLLLYLLTPIICCSILGTSIIIVQNNKQKSIEKQQQIEIAIQEEIRAEEKTELAKNERLLKQCEAGAEDAYWSYVELNGEGNRYEKTGVVAEARFWAIARAEKEDALSNCYKKYNKN